MFVSTLLCGSKMLNRAFITSTTSGELGFRNRKSTRDDLLSTAKQNGKTKKTSWSAAGQRLLFCIWNGTSCNSSTLLARKTASFRAHDVLHRVWFGSRWRCKLCKSCGRGTFLNLKCSYTQATCTILFQTRANQLICSSVFSRLSFFGTKGNANTNTLN